MLTIGDLARLAGTTVRAVRHYHAIGLLAEPPRDASGYRRYGSAALVRVSRVRRMREIGLPLDRIAELLGGPTAAMHVALDELDAELAAQAERIAARRAALARLRAAGGDPEVPGRIGEVYATAAAAGVPERVLAMDKEYLLLDLALHPERSAERLAEHERLLRHDLGAPAAAELWTRFDALADAVPDEAEFESLVAAFVAHVRAELGKHDGLTEPPPARFAHLLEDWATNLPPGQQRLLVRVTETVEAEGRRGTQ